MVMFRRLKYGFVFLSAVMLAASPAPAQPVIDELVSGAQVIAQKNCALLVVKFNVRLRYTSHFPLDKGDELRISLQLIDRPAVRLPRLSPREGVRVANANLAGIRSVAVDLDQSIGPVLRIQFERPVAFAVSQAKSPDSIAVVIAQKGSPTSCKSLGADQNGVSVQSAPGRKGGTIAGAATGPEKPRPGGKIAPEDLKIAAASMDEARAAMEKGKFDEAIRLLRKVLKFPENQYSAEAQELIGVAQQKAGHLAEARAAYEAYLRQYRSGEGADRVKQRLAGVLTATGADHAPLISDAKLRSAKGRKFKFATDDEMQWTQAGSISSYFILDDSSTTLKDISTAPDPNADPDAHRVHQNMLLNNYDLFGTFENNSTKSKYKFAVTEEHGFVPSHETIGISTAFAETTLKDVDVMARVGRQSRSSGGVIGRFDGGLLSWQTTDFVRLNAVAGSPNWSRFDAPFKDGKSLFGVSADFGKVLGGLETSVFAIQQNDKTLVDRQAVGAEMRYFDKNKSALATIDYDVHFQQLNALIYSGSWTFADKSVLTTAADYRKVPYLSSWNALQGQPFLTLYDMLKFNTQDEIKQFALDRTPTFTSAMVGYSYPLSAKYQIGGDATVTNLTGTPPSGGVDGTPASGTEYYLSGQLIGSGIFKPGDMFTAALRYAALHDSNVYVFDFNSRYPMTGNLRVSPRLRLGYRAGTDTDLTEKTILPSVLLDYSLTKNIDMEFEVGPKLTLSEQGGVRTTTKDLEVTLGMRYDFSADGSGKCTHMFGPCSPLAMAGLPASGALASSANSRAAFYKADRVSSVFVVDAGVRYWQSTAKNEYSYYADPTPTMEVSRLSYNNLAARSGEMFFRVDAVNGPLSNFFVKGYLGLGITNKGNLIDEDFPPITDPYSRTQSDTAGKLRYGNIDFGYNFYTDKNFRIGAFTGYHYWFERIDASGCAQIGSNPFICGVPLANSIVVITEQDRWDAIRFGGAIDVKITDRLSWNGDFAFAVTRQSAQDTHYFTFGVSPASGSGYGYQLESILKYQVTDKFNIGVGARWWHYKTDVVDSFDQLLSYQTDRYGLFFQGSYQFH
jgi:TolA-binding protein